jgi:hypothetical protein
MGNSAERDRYASLLLCRLVVVRYLEQHSFLNGDPDYLRRKLARFPVTFYRRFLRPLFHHGLGPRTANRPRGLGRLLGKIPALESGYFTLHPLERDNPDLDIPDDAFIRLFDFLDASPWQLDDRAMRPGDATDPDVLGDFFEKSLDQKQTGAYFTSPDVTGYLARNTIVPFVLDRASKLCPDAFTTSGPVWSLLRDDPERYLFPAARKGVDEPLPDDIAVGLEDVARRHGWNRLAGEPHGLPAETWREYLVRRRRYEEQLAALRAGVVRSVEDLITRNLDLTQLLLDVIANCNGPDLLRALHQAIAGVAVLDPTCGAGAFLFAALDLLAPLHLACLERMEAFPEEVDFREVLARAPRHPSRRYHVLRSIMVHNLHGVDLLDEAVEMCKLRLWLRLASEVREAGELESLADLDFKIRAGNALVGFATRDELPQMAESEPSTNQLGVQLTVVGGATPSPPRPECKNAASLLGIVDEREGVRGKEVSRSSGPLSPSFSPTAPKGAVARLCSDRGGEGVTRGRPAIHSTRRDRARLDRCLAGLYGIDAEDGPAFERWRESHRPLHWFLEFPKVMSRGGFDVILGNPPYLEYAKTSPDYRLLDHFGPFATNLYSACCYRATRLKSPAGRAAFIVPVSLPSTDRMEPLRELLQRKHTIHFASFSTRPGKLFEGAEQRLTLYIQSPADEPRLLSAGYLKWTAEERPALFAHLCYSPVAVIPERRHSWPKVRAGLEQAVFERLRRFPALRDCELLGGEGLLFYKNTGLRYFNTVTLRPPRCWINGEPTASSRETTLAVRASHRHAVHALLLSTTFFLHYQVLSNCRDLNPADIQCFPTPPLEPVLAELEALSLAIEEDYTRKGKLLRMNNRKTGLVELESVTPARSKELLDAIDRVLARCYGFTDEELDYLLNYDIKYRVGADEE